MKTLGIYTKNFSLYHDLLKVLKKRKIPYVSLSSIDSIPSRIEVIITSHSEIHDIKSQKTIAADVYDTIDHAVDIALQMLLGKEIYSKIFIGIDPGEQPGVAVVGDDILLQNNIDLLKLNPAQKKRELVRCAKKFPKSWHELRSIRKSLQAGKTNIENLLRRKSYETKLKLSEPVKKKEIIPEIITVMMINIKIFISGFPIISLIKP